MEFDLDKPLSAEEKNAFLAGQPLPDSPPVDTPPADVPPVVPPIIPDANVASEFRVDAFNKKFGTDFTDEATILDLVSKGKKFIEVDTALNETKQKLTVAEERAQRSLDPKSFFSSEDAFKREQLLIKHKDNPDIIKHISDLTPTRIGKMTDYEALKTNLLIDIPTLDGEKAGAYISDKYGFGGDLEDLDPITEVKMTIDAKAAREKLASLYDGIVLPETNSWEDPAPKLKESWTPAATNLINDIADLKLTDGVVFGVDAESKNGILEEILEAVAITKTPLTEEALREVAGLVRSKLVERNLDKILKHVRVLGAEEEKAKLRSEFHNDKPLNTDTPPPPGEDLNTIALNEILKNL